ncbi:MAG TPA: hypothetical protein ENI61_04395 [Ignavibacteria bacterium]|nr:hypothetical protein [Ignavibacteria bacterium]
MPKLLLIFVKEAIKAFEKLNYRIIRQRSSHIGIRGLIFVVFLAIMFSFISCNKESEGLVGPIPSGIYSYTSYDTSGTAIVKGRFTLNYKDSLQIIGEWHFEKIGNTQNIGPQVGSGKLIGNVKQHRIWIELNPLFRDNNFLLIGTMENNKYIGVWKWISFSGITNHGTFEAEKN